MSSDKLTKIMNKFKMEADDEELLTEAEIIEIEEALKNAKPGDFKTHEQMVAEYCMSPSLTAPIFPRTKNS